MRLNDQIYLSFFCKVTFIPLKTVTHLMSSRYVGIQAVSARNLKLSQNSFLPTTRKTIGFSGILTTAASSSKKSGSMSGMA